jgi:hypothetical protein
MITSLKKSWFHAYRQARLYRGGPGVSSTAPVAASYLISPAFVSEPVRWFLHTRIVRTAEEASDDSALMVTRDRALYAQVLLDFMQRGVGNPNWLGVPMARYAHPNQRIHRNSIS